MTIVAYVENRSLTLECLRILRGKCLQGKGFGSRIKTSINELNSVILNFHTSSLDWGIYLEIFHQWHWLALPYHPTGKGFVVIASVKKEVRGSNGGLGVRSLQESQVIELLSRSEIFCYLLGRFSTKGWQYSQPATWQYFTTCEMSLTPPYKLLSFSGCSWCDKRDMWLEVA